MNIVDDNYVLTLSRFEYYLITSVLEEYLLYRDKSLDVGGYSYADAEDFDSELASRTGIALKANDVNANERMLHKYWITFRDGTAIEAADLKYRCGATAYDLNEAVNLIRQAARGQLFPDIVDAISDVDDSTLDAEQALPNTTSPSARGVWYLDWCW